MSNPTPQCPFEPLLTVEDVGKVLGLNIEGVRYLATRQGLLAYVRVSHKLRFRREDVQVYIDGQRVGTAKEVATLAYHTKTRSKTASKRAKGG